MRKVIRIAENDNILKESKFYALSDRLIVVLLRDEKHSDEMNTKDAVEEVGNVMG